MYALIVIGIKSLNSTIRAINLLTNDELIDIDSAKDKFLDIEEDNKMLEK